jgi:Zinc carboxypeptidase
MKSLIFISIIFMTQIGLGQSLAEKLHNTHENFNEKSLKIRRFKQKDILPLIDKLKSNPLFEVSEVGKSFEKRPIQQIKYGNGPTKVLLWSQMHGDEATATMALFDIFNFLTASGDGFDEFRKQLQAKTTLYFVPMLNPDGAERWQRRTAQEIDMNRDALRLICPESQLLKALQQKYKPQFGFNLHDQSPRYSAGNTPNLATISFLATAYDHARNLNDVRLRSMQLIVAMNRDLQKFIPNQVARYSDEHEPRAFGDNIQKWGTSLVLIESGGYKNDPEKMYIRKLNYVAILTGLQSIMNGSYAKEKRPDYDKIPQNERFHFDLIIRNATISRGGVIYKTDVAINHNEVNSKDAKTFSYRSDVEDFGDLSIFYGIEELDAQGAEIVDANGQPVALKLGSAATFELRKNGQTTKKLKNGFWE